MVGNRAMPCVAQGNVAYTCIRYLPRHEGGKTSFCGRGKKFPSTFQPGMWFTVSDALSPVQFIYPEHAVNVTGWLVISKRGVSRLVETSKPQLSFSGSLAIKVAISAKLHFCSSSAPR